MCVRVCVSVCMRVSPTTLSWGLYDSNDGIIGQDDVAWRKTSQASLGPALPKPNLCIHSTLIVSPTPTGESWVRLLSLTDKRVQ